MASNLTSPAATTTTIIIIITVHLTVAVGMNLSRRSVLPNARAFSIYTRVHV